MGQSLKVNFCTKPFINSIYSKILINLVLVNVLIVIKFNKTGKEVPCNNILPKLAFYFVFWMMLYIKIQT